MRSVCSWERTPVSSVLTCGIVGFSDIHRFFFFYYILPNWSSKYLWLFVFSLAVFQNSSLPSLSLQFSVLWLKPSASLVGLKNMSQQCCWNSLGYRQEEQWYHILFTLNFISELLCCTFHSFFCFYNLICKSFLILYCQCFACYMHNNVSFCGLS